MTILPVVHFSGDPVGDISNADILSGPEVEHSALHTLSHGSPQETLHGIADIGEVAPGIQVPEADRAVDKRLGDDGRNDGACRLARPEGVERAATVTTGRL